ncbi:hypothetical protein MTR67_012925 [Solanum verrucosum]|uniref:Reverse transcriptase zinc-binding domain-containing protein n=1 Tax=Solanum verrucosum TaxID=315347 RepID=A0AAF0TNB3_SOLVR|nr:hypothetical protein MTR67_012925 [Solanum verrucosum]
MEVHLETKPPYKGLCFSWLVAREACLTQENLRRRGFHLCSRCCMCGAARENNSHLFLHCPITGQFVATFFELGRIKMVYTSNKL